MEKLKENKRQLHPFHIIIAWLLVEMIYPVFWTLEKKWYHYVLVLLWMIMLWAMDIVLRKVIQLWWKIVLAELVFLVMVWCGLLLLKN